MPELATSWRMHAHDHGGTFFHIGDRRYVELHGGRDPVVEVNVALVAPDDPAGTHWGWLKTGEIEPSNVWPSRAQFDICFHYGPAAEEKAGHGRVVRLAVHPTGVGDRQ